MAAGMFRVTWIELDEAENVSAVHAVADDATADVVRALAGGSRMTVSRSVSSAELSVIRMPVSTFRIVLDASGKIPGDDPQYRPGLNNSLSRVYDGLISEE